MLLQAISLKLKDYKAKMKKDSKILTFLLGAIITFLLVVFPNVVVFAQDGSADLESIVPEDTSDKVGLEEISIPFFKQSFDFTSDYDTVLSWLGFFASLYTIVIVIFWIIYILRATVRAVRSSGDSEKLSGAYTQIKSVLLAAGLSILFPVLLSLIGIFIGAGSIFQWPKAFRSCNDQYQYYFQALLNAPDDADIDALCGVD
jgi:hypothetical protein